MVMSMKTFSRGITLLGAAIIVSSGVASSSSSSETCDVEGIGNGYCNEGNNVPECNYDGGDCCECTCDGSRTPDDDDACGRWSNFACIDPMAPCVDDDSVTIEMIGNCEAGEMGDGFCDDYNNREECAWDGGDCCSCTCERVGGNEYACNRFACIDPSATCVEDDDITADMLDNCGYVNRIGDGYCDPDNNKAECNYDGGDCCECTCEVGFFADDDSAGGCSQFACIDPAAPCVDEDLITVDMVEKCDDVLNIGDGYCDDSLNKEDCAYDGGDCCECTCEPGWDDECSAEGSGFDCKDPSAPCIDEEPATSYDFVPSGYDDDHAMSDDLFPSAGIDDDSSGTFISQEQEAPVPTLDNAVEVGTKTEVSVTATAHDTRPVGERGCGEDGGDGCSPAKSHDGISSDVESRWSCSPKLVAGGGPCKIEYTFAEPQDIMDIEVAFWKGNERVRTLYVHLDGVQTHTHESYSGSTFNTLNVQATGVSTVTLESVELGDNEWISLIEVLIFVAP